MTSELSKLISEYKSLCAEYKNNYKKEFLKAFPPYKPTEPNETIQLFKADEDVNIDEYGNYIINGAIVEVRVQHDGYLDDVHVKIGHYETIKAPDYSMKMRDYKNRIKIYESQIEDWEKLNFLAKQIAKLRESDSEKKLYFELKKKFEG